MQYEYPPGGGDPIVVGTVDDIDACRPFVLARLTSFAVPSRDREDLAQDVVIVAWNAMREGRIRGPRSRTPEESLRAFLFVVAWATASNYHHRSANRSERLWVLPEDSPALAGPDFAARIEARDALRIALSPGGPKARMFLLAAEGEEVRSAARAEGVHTATYHHRLQVARKALRRRLWDPVPVQPLPPDPRRRKR